MKARSVWILAVSLALSVGCITTLDGEGKMGVGYSSTTEAYAFHRTKAPHPDARSRSEIDVTPIVDLILDLRASDLASGGDESVDEGVETADGE